MRYFLFLSVLVVTLGVSAHAQSAANVEIAPEAIFIDLQPRPGWGPFIARGTHLPQHFEGRFSIFGQDYKIYLLRNPDKPVEDRILFDIAGNDVASAEEDGLSVYYRFETVRFGSIYYDVFGVSPRTNQFVLTRKEDVSYVNVGLAIGDEAPSFEAGMLDTSRFDLDSITQKFVLLNFWGTWCPPCHAETPFLKRAHETFGDRIHLVSVAVDDDSDAVRRYIEENGLTWPQIRLPNVFPRPELVQAYGVRVTPPYF